MNAHANGQQLCADSTSQQHLIRHHSHMVIRVLGSTLGLTQQSLLQRVDLNNELNLLEELARSELQRAEVSAQYIWPGFTC